MTRATVVQNPSVCLEEVELVMSARTCVTNQASRRRRTIPYSDLPHVVQAGCYCAFEADAAAALASYSRCVRRMLHHSLCSAIGMPHSTHTRTRCRGSEFRENSFCHKDMVSSRTRWTPAGQASRPMMNLRMGSDICFAPDPLKLRRGRPHQPRWLHCSDVPNAAMVG